MAQGKKAASVYTEIRARLNKLEKDYGNARKKTNQVASSMQRRLNKLNFDKPAESFKKFQSLLAAGATAAGIIGFTRAVDSAVDFGDQIAKTADKLGVSTKRLQEYRYAAERSGVSTATLEASLERFNRRIGDAATGKGNLVKVLDKYNIAIRETSGATRQTEDIFADIADVIKRVEDPTERARIAYEAFGRSGIGLINVLRTGSAGLDEYAKKAQDLGVVIGDDLTRKAEVARDTIDDLNLKIKVAFSATILENIESITASVNLLITAVGALARAFQAVDNVLDRVLGGKLTDTVENTAIKNMEAQIKHLEMQKRRYEELGSEGKDTLDAINGRLERLNRLLSTAKVDRSLTDFFRDIDRSGSAGKILTGGADISGMAAGTAAASGKKTGPKTTYSQQWGPGELSRFAQYNVLVRDSQKAYTEMQYHVENFQDAAVDRWQMLDSRIDASISNMTDAITNFATTGKLNFKDMASSIISDLIRIQTRMTLTDLFGGIMGMFSPSGPIHMGRGGTTAFGMQHGGYLGEGVVGIGKRSGQSYEFHPNEFVTPANKMGGGNVDVTINNYTGAQVNQRQQNIAGRKVIEIDIGNMVLSGGPLANAIGQRFNLRPVGKAV